MLKHSFHDCLLGNCLLSLFAAQSLSFSCILLTILEEGPEKKGNEPHLE